MRSARNKKGPSGAEYQRETLTRRSVSNRGKQPLSNNARWQLPVALAGDFASCRQRKSVWLVVSPPSIASAFPRLFRPEYKLIAPESSIVAVETPTARAAVQLSIAL